MRKVEGDKCFQPLRDALVFHASAVSPSLDRGFMLAAAAREFGSVPSENDEALFQAVGRHNVSILNTRD
jgi:hypothetical protein